MGVGQGLFNMFAKSLSRELAKGIVDNYNMTPEEKKRRKGQAEADRMGREMGIELEYIETLTQEEYDARMLQEQLEYNARERDIERQAAVPEPPPNLDPALTKEQKNLLQFMRNEGERQIRRLNQLLAEYEAGNMDATGVANEIENLEEVFYNHCFEHTDTFHILPLKSIESVHNEYHQAIAAAKNTHGFH